MQFSIPFEQSSIDVLILRLRRKLAHRSTLQYIRTERGAGYVFESAPWTLRRSPFLCSLSRNINHSACVVQSRRIVGGRATLLSGWPVAVAGVAGDSHRVALPRRRPDRKPHLMLARVAVVAAADIDRVDRCLHAPGNTHCRVCQASTLPPPVCTQLGPKARLKHLSEFFPASGSIFAPLPRHAADAAEDAPRW
ncbi:helix-turn-helix domain-containing protein [Mesorhizobium sp. PL10]